MGGAGSTVVAPRQRDKSVRILVTGVLPPAEVWGPPDHDQLKNVLPLDHDQLKTVFQEIVPEGCKIFTRGLLDDADFGGRCGERPVRMSSYTYADGVVFVVNDDDVLQREKAKRYISHYLDRDLSRASDTLPFLFVISKKGPVGPGEHVVGLDEVDDFVDDLGLKDTALKLPFIIVACDTEKTDSLSEGLSWLRERITHKRTEEEALEILKSAKPTPTKNHSTAVLHKIKNFICR